MIKVDSLTKKYGGFTAVDDITFTARPGRVTGFLGPNGAGKSTTMRIMAGLTPPTSGSATVAGRRYADLPNPGLEVGVLLDASAQHAGRTGREILSIAARTMGLPKRRVQEMLDVVSLVGEEPDRRVRNYSLGVRLTRSSNSSTRPAGSPMVRWAMVRISRPVRPACWAEASSRTPTSRPGLGRSAKRRPLTSAEPDVAGVRPTMIRMVVDFPAPLGPRKPVTRPGRAVKLTSSTAVKPPYFLVRDWTVIMAPTLPARPGSPHRGSTPPVP